MSEPTSGRFYGKYRGLVLNNIDPMQQGRLMVQVPDVAGLAPASWAMPCVPIAGIQNGMVALPMIGSGVWVEFEQGDPEHPIWVGCFWGSAAEIPALALRPRRGCRPSRYRPRCRMDSRSRTCRVRPAGSCSRAPPGPC